MEYGNEESGYGEVFTCEAPDFGAGEDLLGVAEVGVENGGRPGVLGEHRPSVRDDHGVVVDIDDVTVGIDFLRHLVDIRTCRQP